jgi:membrane protease YdiL (CAAX protease family)
MLRRWIEFVLLYVLLPVALLAVKRLEGSFPVLPVLWLAAYPAARYLVARHGWGAKELVGLSLTRRQIMRLLLRLAVAAVVLAGGILLVAPEQFMELPKTNLRLWALVMVLYPLLSVYPQGILYRGLFYARYACLFRSERGAWLAGAAAFSLAHLVFANVWAVALTFAGGLLINRMYRRTGSLLASDLEHAAYGQIVFTTGWGRFLYHGTLRLLEGF